MSSSNKLDKPDFTKFSVYCDIPAPDRLIIAGSAQFRHNTEEEFDFPMSQIDHVCVENGARFEDIVAFLQHLHFMTDLMSIQVGVNGYKYMIKYCVKYKIVMPGIEWIRVMSAHAELDSEEIVENDYPKLEFVDISNMRTIFPNLTSSVIEVASENGIQARISPDTIINLNFAAKFVYNKEDGEIDDEMN